MYDNCHKHLYFLVIKILKIVLLGYYKNSIDLLFTYMNIKSFLRKFKTEIKQIHPFRFICEMSHVLS